MKGFWGFVFLILVSLIGLGCEVVIGPSHPGVVMAPAPLPPPVVAISTRPRLVFLADYGIYVAPDVHYHIFFDGGFWFYFSDGHWYRGKNYNGPWVITEKGIPSGLTKVPPGQLKKMAMKVKHNGKKGRAKEHKKRGLRLK